MNISQLTSISLLVSVGLSVFNDCVAPQIVPFLRPTRLYSLACLLFVLMRIAEGAAMLAMLMFLFINIFV